MVEKTKQEFSKYERARILGARALQISMDAPLLMKMTSEELDDLNFDPLKLAQKELDSGVLPITVNRPMPIRRDSKLKELRVEELEREEKKENEEEQKEDDEEAAVVVENKESLETEMKAEDDVEDEVEEEVVESVDSSDDGGSEE